MGKIDVFVVAEDVEQAVGAIWAESTGNYVPESGSRFSVSLPQLAEDLHGRGRASSDPIFRVTVEQSEGATRFLQQLMAEMRAKDEEKARDKAEKAAAERRKKVENEAKSTSMHQLLGSTTPASLDILPKASVDLQVEQFEVLDDGSAKVSGRISAAQLAKLAK